MPTLIDGYNLLHALGWIDPSREAGDLRRARAALVRRVRRSLPAEEVAQTTIVFDASDAPPGAPQEFRDRGLAVRFAAGYEDADAMIEELIRAAPDPQRLTVVSNDRRIQRAARRRKATPLGCEEWLDRIERGGPRRPPRKADESPPSQEKLAAEEVAYWLAEFGDITSEVFEPSREDDTVCAEEPADEDPSGGKLSADELHEMDDPFPPGYGEDLDER